MKSKVTLNIGGIDYPVKDFTISGVFEPRPQWLKNPGRVAVAVFHSRRIENEMYFGKGAASGR